MEITGGISIYFNLVSIASGRRALQEKSGGAGRRAGFFFCKL
jgi:hypothetical protein